MYGSIRKAKLTGRYIEGEAFEAWWYRNHRGEWLFTVSSGWPDVPVELRPDDVKRLVAFMKHPPPGDGK